jgi:hypothetical protein
VGTFEPIRDAAGGIIGVTPRESDEPLFAAVLRDTLAAVDAAPAAPEGDKPASRPPLSRRQLVGSGAVVALLALTLFALSRQTAPAASVIVRPAAPVPTASQPTAAPQPTIVPPTIARMVVAYAAPGGDVLGPIVLPTAAVARFGDGWAEVTWQGGRVWVRLSDAPDLEIASLPDLQPPTPAPIVVQPAAPPIAADSAAPAEAAPTAHSSNHERPALDRTTPTAVSPYTVR